MLGDVLDLLPDGRFRWLGRASDVVKVGGKRASLFSLNLALTQIPGVSDGVLSLPPGAADTEGEFHLARRLAAFYVSDSLQPREVLAALRARIDPAFLPRPIHRVARLPRNSSGKLPQAALDELFAQHQAAQAIPAGHPALAGHFPGDPVVPGVTLLARVAEALRVRFPDSVPAELLHARFRSPLRPGEAFAIEANEQGGRAIFEVRRAGRDGERGALVANGEWILEQRVSPESHP